MDGWVGVCGYLCESTRASKHTRATRSRRHRRVSKGVRGHLCVPVCACVSSLRFWRAQLTQLILDGKASCVDISGFDPARFR